MIFLILSNEKSHLQIDIANLISLLNIQVGNGKTMPCNQLLRSLSWSRPLNRIYKMDSDKSITRIVLFLFLDVRSTFRTCVTDLKSIPCLTTIKQMMRAAVNCLVCLSIKNYKLTFS